MKKKERILFVLKFRQGYDGAYSPSTYSDNQSYSSYFSSGLFWATKFVVDMLVDAGVEAKLVQVIDNNDIDREVTLFQPTSVIIEALWVVPEKFDVLIPLHPDVQWIVQLHSNTSFLATEGIAVSWIRGYDARGVKVAVNNLRALRDVREILRAADLHTEVVYLPNFYPIGFKTALGGPCSQELHVGCFGAIRPLKNQLIQAVAAMKLADELGKTLHFHINGTRVEAGEHVIKNLRTLFDGTKHHLYECRWMSHERFLKTLARLDIGMQMSFSETFSIVSADMVSVGIPVVVSPEIEWAAKVSQANPTDSGSIVKAMKKALAFGRIIVTINRTLLKNFSRLSRKIWLRRFHKAK
jgi:glycosyltransferase involved in cell wall biosynthesis